MTNWSVYGIMVTHGGNGYGDTGSNPERVCLHFHSTNTHGKGMNPTYLSISIGKL